MASSAPSTSWNDWWKLATPSVFEGETDVVHVDAECDESSHRVARVVDVGVDGAGQLAVILERGDGRLGERVDRVGPDQAVDVERVGVGRVLGRGRRPQGPLQVRAERGEAVPAITGEALAEQLVGEFGLRDRGAAPRGFGVRRSPMASRRWSTSVSTRLTKNDATLCTVDGVAAGRGERLEPAEICLDDLGVAAAARR